MLKITNDIKGDIHVSELPPDTLAVITQWRHGSQYVGEIVILSGMLSGGYNLQSINKSDRFWDSYKNLPDDCRVRILPEGTILEIK